MTVFLVVSFLLYFWIGAMTSVLFRVEAPSLKRVTRIILSLLWPVSIPLAFFYVCLVSIFEE